MFVFVWLLISLVSISDFGSKDIKSEIETRETSNHTKTNIYVAEHFLDIGFKIDGNKISVVEK